jgi:signal transduction histidine kinase
MRPTRAAMVGKTEQSGSYALAARGAGIATSLIGGGHLVAWLTGLMTSRGVHAVTMKTNTALCLLLAGLALVLLASPQAAAARRWAARFCAVLTLLVGVLTLSENLVGWNLHIDQLLATERPGAMGMVSPNRMGTPASISMILAGAALLVLSRRDKQWVRAAQGFGLVIGLIALLGIIGFLYSAKQLYDIARITTIAWPTALALLLLGLGLLCARPTDGLMARFTAPGPGGAMIRRLLLPMVLLPVALGWLRLAGERTGWFDAGLGTSLTMLIFIVTLSTMVFFAGRWVSKAEAALRAAHGELELRVQERTAALHESVKTLSAERQRFNQVLDQLPAYLVLLSRDYRVPFANRFFEGRFGQSQGRRCYEYLFNRTEPCDNCETYKVLKTDQPHHWEWTGPDGCNYDIYDFPFTDVDGSTLIMEVGLDITERKKAESELDKHRQHLEDLVRERTGQFEAARLSAERAKAAAEEANRAKDHFLAVLSHELRTPLTPVLATVSMLQAEEHLDPDLREHLEMVRRNVELEARLIDDLLDVSRISRGKVVLDKRPVRLGEVIGRAIEVCRPDIETRRLSFSVNLGHDEPLWIRADSARLQQVFWNLLKNAIKFTPPGGRVGIRVHTDGPRELSGPRVQGSATEPISSAPSPLVVIEVDDSGEGIAPEALSRIFNAFEQAEQSITRQFGGLGLGLTISKALVEMHGGTIEALSAGKGQGATFRIRLPLLRSPTEPGGDGLDLPPASVRGTPAARPASAQRPVRVLLVEDHGDTARIMTRLLTRQGYVVMAAGDVAKALELAGQQPFDVLISDLGLPDQSGVELLRELRRRGQTLPAIALSGYGQEEDVQRSRDAGFTAHLTKPVIFEQLDNAIAAALS